MATASSSTMDPIGQYADANANANTDAHTRPFVSQHSSASSSGLQISKDPIRHNGVSTPIELRRSLGIRGLVPAAYVSLELDVERCMEQIANKKKRPIDQYTYLQSIQDVSERLYFAILTKYTATVMPIVYTPVVGEGTTLCVVIQLIHYSMCLLVTWIRSSFLYSTNN
jgi:hypothetical protein